MGKINGISLRNIRSKSLIPLLACRLDSICCRLARKSAATFINSLNYINSVNGSVSHKNKNKHMRLRKRSKSSKNNCVPNHDNAFLAQSLFTNARTANTHTHTFYMAEKRRKMRILALSSTPCSAQSLLSARWQSRRSAGRRLPLRLQARSKAAPLDVIG